MATVIVVAAPLFLLVCASIFQNPDEIIGEKFALNKRLNLSKLIQFPEDADTGEPYVYIPGQYPRESSQHLATERVLAEVLRRCDANSVAFLRHRALVEGFVSEATAHLRTLSPLLAEVTVHYDGSAFEGTRTTESADFDTYVLIGSDAVLRQFELLRGAEGRLAARLRPGVIRDALTRDLAQLVTSDGYLDSRRFKKWAFACLETAMRMAADEHPDLRPVVYSKHGATGVNLTAPDGSVVQVDLAAQLAPPPTESVLRPEALSPCGLQLSPAGHIAPWTVYSRVDLTRRPAHSFSSTASSSVIAAALAAGSGYNAVNSANVDKRWFVVNTMRLERDLLSARPSLRNITRLMKSLSASQRWEHRFHIASFVLKNAVFWAFAEHCGEEAWSSGEVLLPMVDALGTLERALSGGWIDKFFVDPPSDNVLGALTGGRRAMLRLAEEVHSASGTLMSGDCDAVRQLFQGLG